ATRAWAEDHVYRGATLLANVRPDGGGGEAVRHVHVDHLGSTRQVTNSAGVEIFRHAFHPFGDEATVVASSDLELKFTGHERDRNDGGVSTLDYLHARYTSPMLGRFLAVDPISGNPGTPQSWNRYAYTLNNPMRFVDPWGLTEEVPLPLIGFDGGSIDVCGNCGQGGWTPPNWLIDNFLWDASAMGAMESARFADNASRSYPAWEAWNTTGGCTSDFWCQVFEQATSSVAAVAAMEYLVAELVLGSLGGKALPVRLTTVRPLQVTLNLPAGKKLGKMLGRFRAAGGQGGPAEFLEHVTSLVSRATQRGDFVSGTVGSGSQRLSSATIYREGSTFVVMDGANVIRSYVPNARPGGVLQEFVRLGGRL
ncbi:MAG: RHS repeat-associated core domain-containing protein, partial [Acidobacteriota bacterium]